MASQLHSPTPLAVDAILCSDAWETLVRYLRLSRREAEIIELILRRGDDEPSIATRLKISSHTVHTHLERLYRKLEVSNRSQLLTRLFVTYTALNRGAVRPRA